IGGLPAGFPLPVLVVLHIGESFAMPFAEWLQGQVRLPVRVAIDGEPLPGVGTPGVVLARPGRHLRVERGRLRVVNGPERHASRPSVDVLFESVAQEVRERAIGVLLTGMGRDGAEGLLEMRRQGALTFAQDESTSVIYGMPKEAARIGAALQILPLPELAPEIVRAAQADEREVHP
ncbi:MAG: CheB methylesterase domain-containing protein, partial [Myxococcales bacterium]